MTLFIPSFIHGRQEVPQSTAGSSRTVRARRGVVGQARHGESVYGGFMLGVAGSVRHGMDRLGQAG